MALVLIAAEDSLPRFEITTREDLLKNARERDRGVMIMPGILLQSCMTSLRWSDGMSGDLG